MEIAGCSRTEAFREIVLGDRREGLNAVRRSCWRQSCQEGACGHGRVPFLAGFGEDLLRPKVGRGDRSILAATWPQPGRDGQKQARKDREEDDRVNAAQKKREQKREQKKRDGPD